MFLLDFTLLILLLFLLLHDRIPEWYFRSRGARDAQRFMLIQRYRFDSAVEAMGERILYSFRPAQRGRLNLWAQTLAVLFALLVLPGLFFGPNYPITPSMVALLLGIAVLMALATLRSLDSYFTCLVITDRGLHWTNYQSCPKCHSLPRQDIGGISSRREVASIRCSGGIIIVLTPVGNPEELQAACRELGFSHSSLGRTPSKKRTTAGG